MSDTLLAAGSAQREQVQLKPHSWRRGFRSFERMLRGASGEEVFKNGVRRGGYSEESNK